jgi:hypothetical protein
MTDRGRAAGWTAAAVLGPVAAAVFAGSTVWTAAQLRPPSSTDAASIAGPVTAGGDPRQVLDDTTRIADLERLVATLRAQASSIAPGPAGARAAAGSGGTAGSAKTAVAAPPARVAVPGPSAARRAARPPAVHTVTGASSAAKGTP